MVCFNAMAQADSLALSSHSYRKAIHNDVSVKATLLILLYGSPRDSCSVMNRPSAAINFLTEAFERGCPILWLFCEMDMRAYTVKTENPFW